jgi:poly-gamma-glutamate capsule biosynthesis protein CapA/YwtB (metallophosphatase superfamily)
MPSYTRVLITRRLILSVLAAIPMRRATLPESVPKLLPRTRIVFGGDIMLSRYVGQLARERRDPAWPLRDLAPVLSSADITFANLESPFSDHGRIYESRMVFKAEPEMISALALAGIDVVSTANNHARDCGRHGVEFTLAWLAEHGIAAVGSGETAEAAHRGTVLERNGLKFGFLAYTYDQSNGNHKDMDDRVAVMDVARMRADVSDLKSRADVTIVSMHAGVEYSPRPNAQQTDFAHAAIEAGASVVVGHHPHVVEPWERYRNGVIFYSLGNLVFDQMQRTETQHGVLGEVVFRGTVVERAGVLPVDIVRTAPRLSAVARSE